MKVITLHFSVVMNGFDDTPLTAFIQDKSVLSLRDHFFVHNEKPYLAVVVVYDPVAEPTGKGKGATRRGSRDESWRTLLSDEQMPLFDTLRSWRAEQSKQEGIPPYVICNNRQLAQIVAARPQTLSALMQIDGLGKAKVEKYGQPLLDQLLAESGDAKE